MRHGFLAVLHRRADALPTLAARQRVGNEGGGEVIQNETRSRLRWTTTAPILMEIPRKFVRSFH